MIRAISKFFGLAAAMLFAADTYAAAGQMDRAEGLTPEPMAVGYLLQLTLGLLVVLIAIGGGVWLLRRVGRFQSGADGALRILGGLSLGTRERVVLMQVGETQLLLGVAPGKVEALHVLDRPVTEVKVARSLERRLAEKFATVLQGVATRRRTLSSAASGAPTAGGEKEEGIR